MLQTAVVPSADTAADIAVVVPAGIAAVLPADTAAVAVPAGIAAVLPTDTAVVVQLTAAVVRPAELEPAVAAAGGSAGDCGGVPICDLRFAGSAFHRNAGEYGIPFDVLLCAGGAAFPEHRHYPIGRKVQTADPGQCYFGKTRS